MKIEKQISGIVLLFLILALFGCSPSQPELTIKTVKELAKKGDALTMSDFAPYESQDVGFGLYSLHYEIDENYYLLIGATATSPDSSPLSIHLVSTENKENYIDIRTDSIDEFLTQNPN